MTSSKEERERKIRDLAAKNVTTLWGCAQSTFCTVVDYLREEEGIELMPPEVEEEMFKALVGLSGGIGNCGIGNCGAVTGASFVISYVSGIGRKTLEKLEGHRWIAFDNVAETIGKKFLEDYHGVRCRDVTWARFGKWYDSWNPAAKAEFSKEEKERGCLHPQKCTIAHAAAFAVEVVLNILKNPRTLEQVKIDHKLE